MQSAELGFSLTQPEIAPKDLPKILQADARPSAAESLQPTKQTPLLDWSMLQMANHHRGPADNNDMGGMRSDGAGGGRWWVGRDLKSTGGFSSDLKK
ncbi:hypothetical protein PAAG_03206 [Paracoccidioides lutzii Pb01]|uniref:Uncharacterized protein n=1 Tax=Paracoccidioides lutzii (strain ATCC MYA-826 / Pb01) TaxID=502779 RepID=C1GYQ2_PARBA|nr:hypothetical protein PAAG_03206 [Paracoccidioides lutzii Pb01]EEH41643.1 hypothetical protein PAAG_03206 [Paracoccidioides lutzii Pb01]